MPVVTNVGKADLALASGVSGVLKGTGGTLVGATPNTDYAPPDSPLIANTITQNTAAAFGFTRVLHNSGSAATTTAPYGESYEGYTVDDSGVIDNVHMAGWLRNLKVAGQPAYWQQWELRWVPGDAPGGLLEYHNNYISIDGSVEYRPSGGFINLNTHASEFTFHNLDIWRLNGFGEGIDDPDKPQLSWSGITGNLNIFGGGINAASFAGNGSALTGLNASAMVGGTLADTLFPTFMKLDSANGWLGLGTGVGTLSGAILTVQLKNNLTAGIKVIGRVDQATTQPMLAATTTLGGCSLSLESLDTGSGGDEFCSIDLKTSIGLKGQFSQTGTNFPTLGVIKKNSLFLSAFDTAGDIAILLRGNDAGTSGNFVVNAGGYQDSFTRLKITPTGIGFNGATPVAKGTITGSRGGNTALQSLLTYLASRGDITDSSSA